MAKDLDDLDRYEMKRVATIRRMGDPPFQTTFEVPEAKDWTQTIYAIVFDGKIERIGSSKAPLRARCKVTDRYLNRKTGEPTWTGLNEREWLIWQDCFKQHGTATIYATIGPTVTNRFGTYNDYLAVENLLLSKYKPRLNNSYFR